MVIVGDAIDEEDRVASLFLASLPDLFSTLVTALEASKDILKMVVVTERLLHAERKQKEKPIVSTLKPWHSTTLSQLQADRTYPEELLGAYKGREKGET